MKALLALAGLLLVIVQAHAGPETIVRERAKELRDQNNVRQGVTPQAPAAQPQRAAATTSAAAGSQLPPLTRLQNDLAAFKPNVPATPEQKLQLTRDLGAVALGGKPSSGSTTKLAGDIADALATKTLSPGEKSRLVQDLNAALNPAGIAQTQMSSIVSDVQAIFQVAGSTRNNAVQIATDLKTVTAEIQKVSAR